MRRTLFRVTSVAAVAALVVAAVASSAFGANGHGRFGPRFGHVFDTGGFGPGGLMGGGGAGFGGPAFGGPGMRGFGFGGHGPGGPGGPGGGGVLTSDLLTPAASFLGISVSTLASDLAGGKTLAQEATAKGKTASDLINAIVAAEKTNLDNEKAAGWITADQETALLARYTAEVTALVNNGPPVPAAGQHGGLLDTAATFLGMSVSDIQSALKSGKTLADLATSKGKTAADLVTALEAPAKANLDQAVKDGKITQAQENTILANLTTHLTNLVNGTKPSTAQMNSLRNSLIKLATLHTFGKRH
jgi:hypothetical protein